MKLSDFKALTFDCYGTLIDWESGMIAGLRPLVERRPSPLSRDAILETHARHESAQQAQTPAMPYARLLATVYRRIAEEWHLSVTWDECRVYGASVGDWPAFPDSVDALAYLKQRFKLVVLSNVDNDSFARSNARLAVAFDAVYTAEDIGAYKPAATNFDYMLANLETLGIALPDILHTAESLFHDHKPGKAKGLACAWIYRRHDKQGFGATMHPGEISAVDFRFNSMADLVAAHRAEIG